MAGEAKRCCLCLGPIDSIGDWTDGHNAEPVANGRCCSGCNDATVIPARIKMILAKVKGGK